MTNFEVFKETLPIIGLGYGGIFGVTILVIIAIKLIGFIKINKK